ncbi:MAG: aminoglycoside phosphotransferase family protein [Eubacterium sp.]|nr:aminoglycoside phosphotransferase family protein [Eubacterium sp.]
MISKTKYLLDDETIKAMFKKADINGITKIAPLGAGEFNAVYEVIADKNYVLKIAPNADMPVLTYEKDMMKAELYWYEMIRENTDIKVPIVYYQDFSKELIPTDWFIMEKLEGRQRNEIKIDKSVITEKTAKMVAQIHNIHNDKFGYIQNGLYDNWYEALSSIITNLLTDAQKAGKKSKNGEKLLKYAQKYKEILMNVPCCMINYDLWDPNVLCTFDENGDVCFSWIDPERSFWGDRIFDFVCLENPIELITKKTESIKYYNSASEFTINLNKEIEIRFAFALGLLALIQEVEKYYRYTPKNFGWWRNIAGHITYYNTAFRVLKNG